MKGKRHRVPIAEERSGVLSARHFDSAIRLRQLRSEIRDDLFDERAWIERFEIVRGRATFQPAEIEQVLDESLQTPAFVRQGLVVVLAPAL